MDRVVGAGTLATHSERNGEGWRESSIGSQPEKKRERTQYTP